MPEPLSKRERLARTVTGAKVDRLPVALWRHFFAEETTRDGLVEAMTAWQKRWDWDFLKINPRASYHAEEWGNQYTQPGNATTPPSLVHAVVRRPEDFRGLDVLDPTGRQGRPAPVLADHLAAIRVLRRTLGTEVPLLMTVFTPMSIAAELAGGPQDLATLIQRGPEMVHQGLRAITATFYVFAAECLEAGADGIFLATTHTATEANFTREQYAEFGRPYDQQILSAAAQSRWNLTHVCQARSMIRDLANYPTAFLNWDSIDPTNPTLGQLAADAPDKALVGGVDRHVFENADGGAALLDQVAQARAAMGARPFVLGATCCIEPTSHDEMVAAFREAAERP